MRITSFKDRALTALLIVLFAAAAVLNGTFLLIWRLWGFVSLEQVLFHFTVPLSGTFNPSLRTGIITAVAGAVLATGLFAYLCLRCRRRWVPVLLLIAAFASAAVLAEFRSGATVYLLRQFQKTKLFDAVPAPQHVKFSFPGKKRNLLVIHMESIEDTFNDENIMGARLMPELERVQKENVHFSGFRQVRGTSWTTAGETGSALGLPLLLPIGHNDYGNYESFLPGALSIFEVLERSGYALEFLFPNDCSFGGIENLIRTHARYPVIKDLRWFLANRADAQLNRGNTWGLRDRYMYEQLKQELKLRAHAGAPFAFFVETIDTHGPDTFYFLDPDTHVPEKFYDFRDVVRAGSAMMGEFLDWVKLQPFADDLTIVILGDHLWMGDSLAGRDLGENRAVYNVFINPAATVEREGPRLFCTPDFAPTILEAVGAKLPGRTFGIGTSLFSRQDTLMERLGEERFNDELGKTSARYNRFFRKPRGYRRAAAKTPVNTFSRPPQLSLGTGRLFAHSAAEGTVTFSLYNTTGSILSGKRSGGLSLLAEVCAKDGSPLPGCAAAVRLPRNMPPQDAEMMETRIPLPPPGEYTLRVSFRRGGRPVPKLPSVQAALTVADRWLFADGPGGIAATEREVLDGAVPCAAFPGMEVYERRGVLFFKLTDPDLEAGDLILRGVEARPEPRALRRAGGDSFRWAAAELGSLSPNRIETGFVRGGTAVTKSFSLLPTRAWANLREQTEARAFAQYALDNGAVVLAAGCSPHGVGVAAGRRGQVLTMQRAAAGDLHFDAETGDAALDIRAATDARPGGNGEPARITLSVNGLEQAVSQSGLNVAAYDPRLGIVAARASFPWDGSGDDFAALVTGGGDSVTGGVSMLPDGAAPMTKGAYVAAWPQGVYVAKYRGRLWFYTPWELAFDTLLTASPLTRDFAPLERAVWSNAGGVISAVPCEDAGVCEIGFRAGSVRHTVTADLSPLYLETGLCRYLRRLNDPDLIVFISVLGEGALRLNGTHRQLFARLGLDMYLLGSHNAGYAAISDGGKKVFEECSARRIDHVQSVGELGVRLISEGGDDGVSSVMLDGKEWSPRSQGMNIVVYSKKRRHVIDSVCFNTFADLSATRKDLRFRRP